MNDIEIQKFRTALGLALEAFAKVSNVHCQYLIAETAIGMAVDIWINDNSEHCHVCIEGDSPRQALADVMNAVQRKF